MTPRERAEDLIYRANLPKQEGKAWLVREIAKEIAAAERRGERSGPPMPKWLAKEIASAKAEAIKKYRRRTHA